jgi:hypothetical protein
MIKEFQKRDCVDCGKIVHVEAETISTRTGKQALKLSFIDPLTCPHSNFSVSDIKEVFNGQKDSNWLAIFFSRDGTFDSLFGRQGIGKCFRCLATFEVQLNPQFNKYGVNEKQHDASNWLL